MNKTYLFRKTTKLGIVRFKYLCIFGTTFVE